MAKVIDLTRKIFGRLTVTKFSHRNNSRALFWECLCECGNICIKRGSSIVKGVTKSCGCIKKEQNSKMFKKHGLSKNTTAEYRAWKAMKKRCYNPNYEHFKDYGARGIIVCLRWIDSFENFFSDMGERPSKKHSLDRYPDMNGNYCPENCRWGTEEQQANNRRNNRWLEHNGIIKTASEWKKYLKCNNLQRSLKYKSFSDIYDFYVKKHNIK